MSSEIQLHKQEVVIKDGEQQVLSIPGEKNISNLELSDLLLEEQQIATRDDKAPAAIIPRVTVDPKTEDYIKYYVPKVVSIGPYHYGHPNLMPIQNLKLDIAKDLFSRKEKNKLVDLHAKLGEPDMLQNLRGYYDEISFSDKEFTNMMLLDACFILYYLIISTWEIFRTRKKLTNHQMISIRQDLFLLENQIPFQVLQLVWRHLAKSLFPFELELRIKLFILDGYIFSVADRFRWARDVDVNLKSGYLLQHLHLILTTTYKQEPSYSDYPLWVETHQHPLPTAKKLRDAEIHFKPSKKLCHFYRHWYWPMSATVKLYPLVVNGSTKLLFINLIAYEASSFYKSNDKRMPVITSYIRLLDSLIGQPEDVKALQDAGVIHDSQGSGSTMDDVKTFIKEIAADLIIEGHSVTFTRLQIIQHYHRFKRFNKPISQFKENYFNSPWSFLALVGAIIALLLTAVQTYITVWSPKGECDDLCKFLKLNHHL